MPRVKTTSSLVSLRELAKVGAAVRRKELEAELRALDQAFALPTAQKTKSTSRSMSPAARKAISRRMKQFWAAHKAAKMKG